MHEGSRSSDGSHATIFRNMITVNYAVIKANQIIQHSSDSCSWEGPPNISVRVVHLSVRF